MSELTEKGPVLSIIEDQDGTNRVATDTDSHEGGIWKTNGGGRRVLETFVVGESNIGNITRLARNMIEKIHLLRNFAEPGDTEIHLRLDVEGTLTIEAQWPVPKKTEGTTESKLPEGAMNWLAFADTIDETPITTQHFVEPKNDIEGWISTTTLFFNYLQLTREKAKTFLDHWLQKVQEATQIDGLNGSKWQDFLSQEEDTLARLLHFKNHYTNNGIELFIATCQRNLIS